MQVRFLIQSMPSVRGLLFTTVLFVTTVLSWLGMADVAFGAQEEPDPPTTSALLDELKKKVDAREDPAAIKIMHQLAERFDEEAAKGQKKIAQALGKCFRRPSGEQGSTLYEATFDALEVMGAEGEKAIVAGIKHRNVNPLPLAVAAGLRSLSQFQNPKHVKFIASYMDRTETHVAAGAAEAFGAYTKVKQAVRKDIVDRLIRAYVGLATSRIPDAGSEAAVREAQRLSVLQTAFLGSLKKLTGEDHFKPRDWQQWFQSAKKEKWPDLETAESK